MKPRNRVNPHQVGLHVHQLIIFGMIRSTTTIQHRRWEIPKRFTNDLLWFLWHFRWLGWTVEPLDFWVRKPGEPWGTPCEISNMSFGDAGWQGGFRWRRELDVPHDLMMGCSYGVWIDRGCECLWMLWPVTHMAIYGPYSCDQKRFFKEEKVPKNPSNLLNCWGCAVHLSQWQHGNLHCRLHRGRVCCPDPWWNVQLRLPVGVDCSFRQTRRHLMSYPPGI